MLSPRLAILITASRWAGEVRDKPAEVDGTDPNPAAFVGRSSAGSGRERETDLDRWLGEEEDRFVLVLVDCPMG